MRRLVAALMVLAGVGSGAQAETAVIRISGYVPVICHAEFTSSPVQQGSLIQLGTIREFCNDSYGYELIADHSAGDDPGALIIDGLTVPLNGSGHTILASVSGPRAITQTVAYRPGSTPITILSIQVRASSI